MKDDLRSQQFRALVQGAPAAPAGMSAQEWQARLELAACYRLFDWLGWAEMIFNHITLRIPGGDEQNPHYLINPFGLHYAEVTARNLVKVDVQGNKVDGSLWPINLAGFTIHSVVHAARADAHCVMHTHTTSGMAVACKEEGLRADNFYSALLYGRVGYHDFEGVTTSADEGPRLRASLGQHDILILRNHGLLVLGPHIPAAFQRLWTLQRACDVQLASDSLRGANWSIDESILKENAQRDAALQLMAREGDLVFQGILRRAGIRAADLAG